MHKNVQKCIKMYTKCINLQKRATEGNVRKQPPVVWRPGREKSKVEMSSSVDHEEWLKLLIK